MAKKRLADKLRPNATLEHWPDAHGLWMGIFPYGADVSPIPEIAWPATGPLTKTSPWRFVDLRETLGANRAGESGDGGSGVGGSGVGGSGVGGSFAWSMDSKVRGDVDVVVFSGGFEAPKEEARATLRVTDALDPGQVGRRKKTTDETYASSQHWVCPLGVPP